MDDEVRLNEQIERLDEAIAGLADWIGTTPVKIPEGARRAFWRSDAERRREANNTPPAVDTAGDYLYPKRVALQLAAEAYRTADKPGATAEEIAHAEGVQEAVYFLTGYGRRGRVSTMLHRVFGTLT